MILREIHTDEIAVLLAEFRTGCNSDVCLQAAELRELENIDLERRQFEEDVAAALRRARPAAGALIDDRQQVVADTLMLGNALFHPALRLGEPIQEGCLAVARAAQRNNCLELLHAGDDLRRAVADAQTEAAERLSLGGADDGDERVGLFLQRTQVDVLLILIEDLTAVKLVGEDGDVILLGKAADLGDLLIGVHSAGGVVGVGVQEELYAALEGFLKLLEVNAGAAARCGLPMHLDGNDLALKELDELAVVKVIRLDDGDFIAAADEGAHCEEQRALRARGKDDLRVGIDRSAAVFRQLFRQILADGAFAAVFGVGLIGALRGVLLHEGLKAAGDRGVCVDIAVGKVYCGTVQLFTNDREVFLLLKPFLAGSVVCA